MSNGKHSTRKATSQWDGLIATARAMTRREGKGAEKLRALIRLLTARQSGDDEFTVSASSSERGAFTPSEDGRPLRSSLRSRNRVSL